MLEQPDIVETDLPGIGTKFRFDTERRERVITVVHNDGLHEVYLCPTLTADPSAVIALSEEEARSLGSILAGMFGGPRHDDTDPQLPLPDLSIDWTPVPEQSPLDGRTIAEAEFRQRTDAFVVAILRDGRSIAAPQADQTLLAGDMLVTVGARGAGARIDALVAPVAAG